jgi:hypothetical protein
MRAIVLLLLSLVLAGCGAGSRLSGDEVRAGVTAPAPAGTSTTTAAATPPATAAASQAPPPSGPRDLTEAKVICWGKVEREKQRVRTIDQRIAYVERCVADQMKTN